MLHYRFKFSLQGSNLGPSTFGSTKRASLPPPTAYTTSLQPHIIPCPAYTNLGTALAIPTPPPPPLQPEAAASAAPRGPRPRPSPRARPSRAGANASIVPAISPHFVSTCKRARARSKGMCGGEVACTSTRKSAAYPQRRGSSRKSRRRSRSSHPRATRPPGICQNAG